MTVNWSMAAIQGFVAMMSGTDRPKARPSRGTAPGQSKYKPHTGAKQLAKAKALAAVRTGKQFA